MYSLIYSNEANLDLVQIFEYIAMDSRERAVSFMDKMKTAIELLAVNPKMSPFAKYTELKALGIHTLIFEKYLIFYIIKEDKNEIDIVRVKNGATNYKNLF